MRRYHTSEDTAILDETGVLQNHFGEYFHNNHLVGSRCFEDKQYLVLANSWHPRQTCFLSLLGEGKCLGVIEREAPAQTRIISGICM